MTDPVPLHLILIGVILTVALLSGMIYFAKKD